MSHNSPSVPRPLSLDRNDFTIGRAAKAVVFDIRGTMGCAASRLYLTPVDNSVDLMIAHWVSSGALALSGAAVIILSGATYGSGRSSPKDLSARA